MKRKDVVSVLIWTVCLSVLVGLLAWGLTSRLTKQDEDRALRHVCQWEGGQVQGDVCVKAGVVIITKREVLRRVQTP